MLIGYTADTGALRAGAPPSAPQLFDADTVNPCTGRPQPGRGRRPRLSRGLCMPTVLTGWDMPPLA